MKLFKDEFKDIQWAEKALTKAIPKMIKNACSAGIHRTGMVTYGLLRSLGNEKTEAAQILQSLREVTSSQVGEDRLLWGD